MADRKRILAVDAAAMIQVNDIVFHLLSLLYFKCENKKMERWMNMNPYYIKSELPQDYIL